MSTHRNIDRICMVVLALTLLLTVAFLFGEKLGIEVVADADAETYAGTEYFTANDLDGDWDTSSATYITLDGAQATVTGSGAYAYDGGVVIAGGGRYVLSGTLTDGSIVVDAYASSKVWLLLDGVDVTCTDNACLIVEQADKVFLTLAEGSENRFVSGAAYSEAALADGAGGAIFARDDLTINGSGSLSVTAGYKHGIDANDSLVITGGTVTVTAAQDGIHVNDSFRFAGASLTVQAGDDAIHCDAEIYVESGTILVTDCYEGLEAVTIDIAGGEVTVYARDDGLNANGSVSGMMGMGGFPGAWNSTETETGTLTAEETYIRVTGGTVTVVNESGTDADGFDSNGSIYLEGGTVRISLMGSSGNCALDYGSESGGELVVTGGSVIACGDSSMAEAFSSSSSQGAVLYNLSSAAAAGTAFSVLDGAGNELLYYVPPCSYSSVAFSCPELKTGESFTVCVGEDNETFTLTGTAMTLGTSSGMGGMGGMGKAGGTGGMKGMGRTDTDSADGTGRSRGDFAAGEDSERPTPPDGTFAAGEDGEQSTPPDGTFAAGEDGEQPTPPDGTFAAGEDGGFSPLPEGNGFPFAGQAEETAADTAESAAVPGASTWLLLGICVLVLAAGILLAALFRRHQ